MSDGFPTLEDQQSERNEGEGGREEGKKVGQMQTELQHCKMARPEDADGRGKVLCEIYFPPISLFLGVIN